MLPDPQLHRSVPVIIVIIRHMFPCYPEINDTVFPSSKATTSKPEKERNELWMHPSRYRFHFHVIVDTVSKSIFLLFLSIPETIIVEHYLMKLKQA